ncbi:sporulation integral membrane protein YlbJ [Defluviitalea raffinosedens]|jgi:sporulation integral membrane protein YlbJ|uniref:Sporulation integral membrane protein YlbJ n=1 Tax=Defluviitalea raffinosedens TaxID=1450156 RepID=A0A7C8HGD9_9FIRM|nr:sporulation integral membrane protein YlbJ [Defluviitalea raffinosedens]KAE9637189.1 sporulation integral membrane protein YlbJ [Defluviitalea raffinosedens]MBM7685486.1 sporulation integral membrane protein YlbJ [Defluviitalea raffinosedens]HHW66784.1 sporulation integral membrane protein YlbJ [Candidatus Epulonipiscium sp.]
MGSTKNALKRSKLFFIAIVIFTVGGIILFPQEVFNASKKGLLLWFNTVFPSLFPFMIGTYLLIELGIVRFIGVLFEPIMRPLFNVPGVGAFAWIMGLTSGYPVGAKITADLRAKGQITQVEAQRLIAFSNNSGPLFILGAVSVGMLSNPEVGMFLLGIHYLSSLSVGLLFRFYKREATCKSNSYKHLFKRAIEQLIQDQKMQSKKIGFILKESIIHSMDLVTQIGGFIILFSVVAELLKIFSIMDLLSKLLHPVFLFLGFDKSLINGWILAIIEITNGINMMGSSSTPLIQQLILINSVIAWGGISILMQTVSVISHSDINVSVYALAKFIQAIFAMIYTMLLYPQIKNFQTYSVFNTFQYFHPHNPLLQTWTYVCSSLCILFIILNFIIRKKACNKRTHY